MEFYGIKISPAEVMAAGFASQWILSAVVDSLPEADATSSKFYHFVFKFLHAIAANLSRVRPGNTPPPPSPDPPKVVPIDRAA